MNEITILENEQVEYIKIVEDIKESLSKVLFTKEVSDIGLANEDMNKGAIIAYQDIYNRILELEHSEKQYDYIEEKNYGKSIKRGKGASRLNIPLQKSVPPMPKKNKEYKEKCSWVSVKDRLPEVNKEVFVYLFPSDVPYIAWWNGTHWQTDEFCLDDYLDEGYEPLAWFPLPEPYKGE